MNRQVVIRRWGITLLLVGAVSPAPANVPLADRETDRQAKAAAPMESEVLVYAYRADDTEASPVAVTLSGNEPVRLVPRTFALWRAKPGRIELSVERSASVLTLPGEAGRVYYVEVGRGAAGVPVLRPVSFANGRTQVYRSQLVAQAGRGRLVNPTIKPVMAPRDERTHGAVMLKFGTLKLANTEQTILAARRTFDDSASAPGIEGEWFLRPDISLGLELARYSNDFTTPTTGLTGEADTTVLLFNIKRYFLPDSAWQPYVGAGVGSASTTFSGTITGNTSGLALQAVAGIQWRHGSFALRGELRHLKADTEDDNGQEVDVSGAGAFIGAGFYF